MKKIQILLIVLFLLITTTTFSPLVIPHGVTEPWFLSMPRTLWLGILISILLAILTLVAAFTIKTQDEKDAE